MFMAKSDIVNPASDKYVEAETVSEDSDISSLSNFTDGTSEKLSTNEILIIEPFYGGSHKQLVDLLEFHLNKLLPVKKVCLFSLPAKKWHWRARTSALYFFQTIPERTSYKTLFCSSVLNLAELIALRPDLSKLQKVVYFHENQLIYPVRKQKDRDFQYGYNQILSCLVADIVAFNSYYNMNSFLENIDNFLKLQPNFVCNNLSKKIIPKCRVLYFPVEVPLLPNKKNGVLHIIWPHRWEHDKNPKLFFETLFRLKTNQIPFVVSVLGESFSEIPDIFEEARNVLKDEILQFGRMPSKDDYYRVLRSGHVVVSTAIHEFFGVAMLEAVLSGCFPIACNCLVYPEIYPPQCLYNTPNQLYKKLKILCEKPYLAEIYLKDSQINLEKFKVNPFLEGISKVKDLIKELEESFRESNNISNNLILRCVLLRAENQNLTHKIDQRKSYSNKAYNKEWELPFLSQNRNKFINKIPSSGDESKPLTPTNSVKTNFQESPLFDSGEEIDILHNTIGDLQKKLRERDSKIDFLCQKYMYLKTNKAKMETDLQSQITSLEEQLDVACDTLSEFQSEIEADIEGTLSSAINTYEALFLQEKLRCSKLMYERVRLHHEIQRLEDLVRRQGVTAKEKENNHWLIFKSSADKKRFRMRLSQT